MEDVDRVVTDSDEAQLEMWGALWISHRKDPEGRPFGGLAGGPGLGVWFQAGPLEVDGVRRSRNGAFVEDLIRVAISRLEFYQAGQFACQENAEALNHLRQALEMLGIRTWRRIDQGVEGTWEGN